MIRFRPCPLATSLLGRGPHARGDPPDRGRVPRRIPGPGRDLSRDGDLRVPPDAELYVVFDEPTTKTGSFSVADLDSGGMGVLLNLDPPRWSALGDTVYLRPSAPMSLGHRHGDAGQHHLHPDSSANDLPIVFFTVHPTAPGAVVITDIVLEEPLPGAAFAAGDTVRARAVVMGAGTGPFRVVFYMDGTAVAMEEGFMENGRPVTIEPRGPITSRRLGERRLHVAVESPQILASRPVTFLSLPPPVGLEPKRRKRWRPTRRRPIPGGPHAAPGTPRLHARGHVSRHWKVEVPERGVRGAGLDRHPRELPVLGEGDSRGERRLAGSRR